MPPDTNPYKVSQASLESPPPQPSSSKSGKKHWLWKVVFFLLLTLQIFNWSMSIDDLFGEQADTLLDILDLTVYPFMIIGLYGYVFQKMFFHKRFWQYFFPIFLIIDLYIIIVDSIEVFQETETIAEIPIITLVFGLILTLLFFTYYALYHYAYKDKLPWSKLDTK